MDLVGLDGEYLVGIKICSLDKEAIQDARKEQLTSVVKSVSNTLSNLTVSDITNLVSGNKSVSSLLEGFGAYQGYSIGTLKDLMKPSSLQSVIGTAVKGLSAAARIANPLPIKPTKDIGLVIREQDFLELKIEEFLGIMLPVFSVTFAVQDKKLYKYFNKNSTIEISFGKTMDDLNTMHGIIFKPIIKDQEQGGLVTLRGFLDASGFLEREDQYYGEGTSFELVSNFIQAYNLTLSSNQAPDQFQDKMIWRSPTSRPIDFVVNIWKHSFVTPTSQIAPTILATGEMLWTDLSKARELVNTPDYKFQYGDRILLKQNPFYANFGSIRNQRYVFSTEATGMEMLKLNDQKSVVTTDSNEIIETGNKAGKYSILTPEMHSNWYLAELLNCSKVFSSLNQTAWIRPDVVWKKYKPTDIVTIESVDSPDAGQYLVCGRVAQIQNRKFNTWLQIGRDNYLATTGTDLK